MRVNFQYAIGIIAALSLLLGLSLGQLHHQYREIEMLKQQPTRINMATLRPFPAHSHDTHPCNKIILKNLDQELKNWMDIERARVEQEKQRAEEIKAALREGIVNEVKRDKTHVILQEEL